MKSVVRKQKRCVLDHSKVSNDLKYWAQYSEKKKAEYQSQLENQAKRLEKQTKINEHKDVHLNTVMPVMSKQRVEQMKTNFQA